MRSMSTLETGQIYQFGSETTRQTIQGDRQYNQIRHTVDSGKYTFQVTREIYTH